MKINYYSTKGILLSKQFLYRTTRGQYCFNQDLQIFFANQILLTEVCKTWSFCYLCRNVIIKFSGMKIAAHITVRKESSRLINVREQGFFFLILKIVLKFSLVYSQFRIEPDLRDQVSCFCGGWGYFHIFIFSRTNEQISLDKWYSI